MGPTVPVEITTAATASVMGRAMQTPLPHDFPDLPDSPQFPAPPASAPSNEFFQRDYSSRAPRQSQVSDAPRLQYGKTLQLHHRNIAHRSSQQHALPVSALITSDSLADLSSTIVQLCSVDMLSPRGGDTFGQRPRLSSSAAARPDINNGSASQLPGGLGHANFLSSHDPWTDSVPSLAGNNSHLSTEQFNTPTPPVEYGTRDPASFLPDGPAKKRARPSDVTESSNSSSSRKRAVTACRLCRTRKTKCSNTRPKCRFCIDNNAECVYEDAATTALYAFDPATCGSLILERLDQVLDRLDLPTRQNMPSHQHAAPEASAALHQHRTSITSPHQSPNSYDESGRIDNLDEEYLRIPSSRATCDVVLQWPIFNGRYAANLLLEPLFEAGLELDSDDESEAGERISPTSPRKSAKRSNVNFVAGGEDMLQLVDNFIAAVHTKNPILEIHSLQKYARRVAEDGPGWDGKSCLVLLACALGSIAKPYSESLYNASIYPVDGTSSSTANSRRELDVAEGYYGLARKRIGLLGNTIIRSQCYLLSGVYLMYALRPLEAWQNFVQASTTYYIYLKSRMHKNSLDGQQINRTRRLEQRLYWSCFKSECEIRVEVSLPESSLADLRYPDPFPSPPVEDYSERDESAIETTPRMDFSSPSASSDKFTFRSRRTDSMHETQQQSWYYYLIEIALRRIENRILNALNPKKHGSGFGVPVAEMLRIAIDFEKELLQWQEKIPAILAYDYEDLCNIPTNELAYSIRGRTVEIKICLYSPFLHYAIHYPADDPYQQIIQPFVEKALQHGRAHIRGLEVRHRHHGTWYGLRTATAVALCLIAAAKCGHVRLLETWVNDVKMQIALLRYWGGEATDSVKAAAVLQEMLDEVT